MPAAAAADLGLRTHASHTICYGAHTADMEPGKVRRTKEKTQTSTLRGVPTISKGEARALSSRCRRRWACASFHTGAVEHSRNIYAPVDARLKRPALKRPALVATRPRLEQVKISYKCIALAPFGWCWREGGLATPRAWQLFAGDREMLAYRLSSAKTFLRIHCSDTLSSWFCSPTPYLTRTPAHKWTISPRRCRESPRFQMRTPCFRACTFTARRHAGAWGRLQKAHSTLDRSLARPLVPVHRDPASRARAQRHWPALHGRYLGDPLFKMRCYEVLFGSTKMYGDAGTALMVWGAFGTRLQGSGPFFPMPAGRRSKRCVIWPRTFVLASTMSPVLDTESCWIHAVEWRTQRTQRTERTNSGHGCH